MQALHYSVVMKRELSKKVKLSVFKTVFVPILTYGHESWVMTERMRSQTQASEMRFLRRIEGVRFENLLTSSRYFSKLNNLSLDGLAMEAECLRKDSLNKLYMPKQMGEDQSDDLELDGPITLRILDGIAWDFALVK